MKLFKYVLISTVIVTLFLNVSSKKVKRDDEAPGNDGEHCFSIGVKGAVERKCAAGLVCRRKNPNSKEKGGSKQCLAPL